LFLDTAVESEWESLLPLGIFHGITTNPSLLETAGHECTIESLQTLAKHALSLPNCNEFMCQSFGSTSEELYKVGMDVSQIDRERVVMKVPCTIEGTYAASKLVSSGVRVCLTACYSSDQALIAAGLNVDYIAPYLGRMTDNGKNGMEECQTMQKVMNHMDSNTRVLVASIRNARTMTDLISSTDGMDTFTFNPKVARQLFEERLTLQSAKDFEDAAKRCNLNNKKKAVEAKVPVSSANVLAASMAAAGQGRAAAIDAQAVAQAAAAAKKSQYEVEQLKNQVIELQSVIQSGKETISSYQLQNQQQQQQMKVMGEKQLQLQQQQQQQQQRQAKANKPINKKDVFKWS
jgi:transaldolase